jgi:hypothetical protein
MVEIEEIADATKESSTPTDKLPPPPPGYKYRKSRKELPSISYLLAHGDPELQGKPKTWTDVLWFPIFLCVCFVLSLMTWHYAPHSKSVQPKGKYHMQYKMAEHRRQQEQLYQAREAAMMYVKPVSPETAAEAKPTEARTSTTSSEGEL